MQKLALNSDQIVFLHLPRLYKKIIALDEVLYLFIALRSKGIYGDTSHCAERIVHHVNSLRIKIQCKPSYTGASSGRSELASVLLLAHSLH